MKKYEHTFDFEIGTLIKSPCRDCGDRPRFPKCIDTCDILDRIHGALTGTVSCSGVYSSSDTYLVTTSEWPGK